MVIRCQSGTHPSMSVLSVTCTLNYIGADDHIFVVNPYGPKKCLSTFCHGQCSNVLYGVLNSYYNMMVSAL